ncbi:hypothetical protein [Brachybacterium sp. GPGPB12]|uniref:hypothetical protein n=1 Tax=Brachybacterium sp. GPGPB12 TaxID=3023517 RepID=UPI0031344992
MRTEVRSESTTFSAAPERISSTACWTRAWYSSGVWSASSSSGAAAGASTGEEGNRSRQEAGGSGSSSIPTTVRKASPSWTPSKARGTSGVEGRSEAPA